MPVTDNSLPAHVGDGAYRPFAHDIA